jgi:hypothetical protein
VHSFADGVRLAHPTGELFVQLTENRDAEVMDEQALGVRLAPVNTWVGHLALQVEVAVEPS